jgi:hypothetical protein
MREGGKHQIFLYWIELRELASGSVRELPLTAVIKICLARRNKNDPPIPRAERCCGGVFGFHFGTQPSVTKQHPAAPNEEPFSPNRLF